MSLNKTSKKHNKNIRILLESYLGENGTSFQFSTAVFLIWSLYSSKVSPLLKGCTVKNTEVLLIIKCSVNLRMLKGMSKCENLLNPYSISQIRLNLQCSSRLGWLV